MYQGATKVGYCDACRQNLHHFREHKTGLASFLDLTTLFVLDFGPWFCSQCDRRSMCLPWIRRREPTARQRHERVDEGTERIGNFIRSDGSLVMRKKRSSRFSKKFRDGVVKRLLSGRTTIAQLSTELNVTESDLLSWVNDVVNEREQRITELSDLLRSYTRAAADLIRIGDESPEFDEQENMIEGRFERRQAESSSLPD